MVPCSWISPDSVAFGAVSGGADLGGVVGSQEEVTIERAATQEEEEERLRYLEFVQQAAAQVLAALPRRRPHRGHRQGCRGLCS